MYVQIFFFRSHSSPDMALRLIDIQHLPCLLRQSGIDLHEPVCYVLMYGRLADTEGLCRLAHSGVVVNNIAGDVHGTLFNIILQKKTP